MSTPERPVLPDHPTRQQLDELDALMERMLALPVNQPELSGPMPKLPARPVKALSLPIVQATVAVPERVSDQGSGVGDQGVLSTQYSVLSTHYSGSGVRVESLTPDSRPLTPDPWPLTHAGPAVPFWLRPAVWCNRVYDSGTALLGPAGRCLRGTKARTVLGLSGIALITAALLWAAVDTWGWTW
jgi:hypothetical protein